MDLLKRRVWLISAGSSRHIKKIGILAIYIQQQYSNAEVLLLLLQSATDKHSILRLIGDVFKETDSSIDGIENDVKFYFFWHRPIPENIYLHRFLKKNSRSSILLFRNLIHLEKYFETGRDDRTNVFRTIYKSRRIEFFLILKVYLLAGLYSMIHVLSNKTSSVGQFKKILIVKFDVFGDMVIALPYLEAIKKNFPSAEVTLLASKKGSAYLEAYADNVGHKIFDKNIAWDAPWHYRRTTTLSLKDFVQVIKMSIQLRRNNYDCVIQCREHGTSVWFSRIAAKGVVYSIYDSRLLLSFLMSRYIENKIDVSGMDSHHMVDFPRLILQNILPGICIDDTYLKKVKVPPFAWAGTQRIKILINLGAGMPIRQWDSKKYAELIQKIYTCLSVKPVLLCGQNETHLFDEVVETLKESYYGYRGNLNLTEVIRLVAQTDIVVTPDTGVMHLAAAFDKKILALFGAGEVELCRPLGNRHIIVRKELGCSGCGDYCFQDHTPPPCLDTITVDEMFIGLMALIQHGTLEDSYEKVAAEIN